MAISVSSLATRAQMAQNRAGARRPQVTRELAARNPRLLHLPPSLPVPRARLLHGLHSCHSMCLAGRAPAAPGVRVRRGGPISNGLFRRAYDRRAGPPSRAGLGLGAGGLGAGPRRRRASAAADGRACLNSGIQSFLIGGPLDARVPPAPGSPGRPARGWGTGSPSLRGAPAPPRCPRTAFI